MAAKTNQIGTGYTGTPNGGRLIGEAYLHQQEDRGAIVEVIDEEHYLVPGTSYAEHGRHLPGAAVAYLGTVAPTQRPNASDALGVLDVGRLWLDTSALPLLALKVYKEVSPGSGTYGWTEVFRLKVWNDDPGTFIDGNKVEKVLSELTDQVLKHNSTVTFTKVTAGSFVGPLVGTADKVRTSAPTSPAAGDIWVE